jgi:hypothetical protein
VSAVAKPRPSVVADVLRQIASEHDGLLRPEWIVEEARPTTSPLHGRFTWDDSRAAELFRLEEARHLIRVTVELLPVETADRAFRVFVSLRADRHKDGGYRASVTVLADHEGRAQLLREAKADMLAFTRKYRQLSELARVFAAMDEALP